MARTPPSAANANTIRSCNPALRPLRGLAQDQALLRKAAKAKGLLLREARKREEPRPAAAEKKQRVKNAAGATRPCAGWYAFAQSRKSVKACFCAKPQKRRAAACGRGKKEEEEKVRLKNRGGWRGCSRLRAIGIGIGIGFGVAIGIAIAIEVAYAIAAFTLDGRAPTATRTCPDLSYVPWYVVRSRSRSSWDVGSSDVRCRTPHATTFHATTFHVLRFTFLRLTFHEPRKRGRERERHTAPHCRRSGRDRSHSRAGARGRGGAGGVEAIGNNRGKHASTSRLTPQGPRWLIPRFLANCPLSSIQGIATMAPRSGEIVSCREGVPVFPAVVRGRHEGE